MIGLGSLKRRGLAWLGKSRWYSIGGVRLELPAEHLLPEYQAAHPLYDRFLPHLAAQLAPGDAVVDVGANVGDTVAALLSGQGALQLQAIEPDAGFFALLERNAERLRAAWPAARIELRSALVGQVGQPLTLVGGEGTRRAVPAPPGTTGRHARRLDDLLATMDAAFTRRLRLVKCDVDGADHEVIASAREHLLRHRPLLFFECQVADRSGRDRFLDALQPLVAGGYDTLFLFDNFGHPLPDDASQPPLQRLALQIDLVLQPPAGAVPIHYLDVLLVTAADRSLAERAIATHRGGPR